MYSWTIRNGIQLGLGLGLGLGLVPPPVEIRRECGR